jgi:hypothetical protein
MYACKHLWSVKAEHGIECSRKGEHGESRSRHRLKRSSAQEWIQVSTMIRMSMRDHDCIDGVSGDETE